MFLMLLPPLWLLQVREEREWEIVYQLVEAKNGFSIPEMDSLISPSRCYKTICMETGVGIISSKFG